MSEKQDLQLGKIIGASTVAERDAIHIAVAPVVAAGPLYPGTHVGLNEIGEATTKVAGKYIGIVDPFLRDYVKTGQRFWLYLYPNTITALRHDWRHPAFQPVAEPVPARPDPAAQSEAWLRAFANEVGVSYDRLMVAAKEMLETGSFEVLSYDTPSVVYDQREAFWSHYEMVTGVKVPQSKRDETFFSCSC